MHQINKTSFRARPGGRALWAIVLTALGMIGHAGAQPLQDPLPDEPATAWPGQLTGWIATEAQLFTRSATGRRQDHSENVSLAAELEYHHAWDKGRQVFRFVSFYRHDPHDERRTHFDMRELIWTKADDQWELKAGIGKVFWGVTESQHLVDIINQTDLIENVDGEDKLGQPMVNLSLIGDWGTVGLFVLPGFRERTFPGSEGRLRTAPPVDTDRPLYESGARQWHVDYAVRWFQTIGALDIGAYHFFGTSREPQLVVELDGSGRPSLRPRYDLIHQTGLDAQLTIDNWLWKVEAIARHGQGRGFHALVGGFEYTLFGLGGSQADLGLLLEYSFDDRPNNAAGPFQNDLFTGLRFVANDTQSTEVLAGVTVDLDSGARAWNIEASRRFGSNWKASLEARIFADTPSDDPLNVLSQDDSILLELKLFF